MPEHPDDFDRRLARRLRAYDSGFPAGTAPDPRHRGGTDGRWPALIGVAGAAVVAGALLGVALLDGPRSDVAQSTATPTPTAASLPVATPHATPSPTATPVVETTPSPSAASTQRPAATPVPTPLRAEGWSLAARFGEGPDRPHFVFDATSWDGRFVAIGIRLDHFANDCCTWTGQPMLWTSADGLGWEGRPLGIDVGNGLQEDDRIRRIVALPDGRLMATASRNAPSSAWISADAMTWTPIEILPADTSLTDIAAGPRGLSLVAGGPGGEQQVWYSADGLAWEVTHEADAGDEVQLQAVGAGAEGFVVVGASRTDTDRPYVLASSDGRTWYTAPEQPAFTDGDLPFDVAPLGPDWVATGFGAEQSEQRALVWRSADGLSWTRDQGPRDPGGRDSYYATDIAGDGGIVVLSPAEAQIGGPFQFPTYAWSSTDGVEWDLIELDGSYVTEVVTIGSTTVAVGTIGRGDEAAFWVLQR